MLFRSLAVTSELQRDPGRSGYWNRGCGARDPSVWQPEALHGPGGQNRGAHGAKPENLARLHAAPGQTITSVMVFVVRFDSLPKVLIGTPSDCSTVSDTRVTGSPFGAA